MNELERILAKNPDERTSEDLEYLEEHSDELNDDQLSQLDDEATDLAEDEESEEAKEEPKEEPVEQPAEEPKEEPKPLEVDPAVSESIKKDIGKTVVKDFSVTVKDLGHGVLEAIVSSEALDRHGEKIDMRGMDIKQYMQNPIIADFHDYSKPSLGKTTKLTKTKDGQMIARMEFAVKEYDRAKLIYDLYAGGFQRAFSIGFIPLEVEGNTYTKATMIEYSTVLVPANAEALLLSKQKSIDNNNAIPDNVTMKYNLDEILKKAVDDLTVGEIKFLKENADKLSTENKTKYASVLVEKNVAEEVSKMLDEKMEAFKKDLDPTIKKDIKSGQDANKSNIEIKDVTATKEEKFQLYVKGLVTNDFSDYKKVTKDGMTTSNTSEVLPPTEFVAEVERLEEQYGAARQGGVQLRRSNNSSLTLLMGDDDLEIFDTAEAGHKSSTKMGYTQWVLNWRKFAGILPLTDELLEESAIDLWREASTRFARAYTKKEDELVFTETQGAGKNPGIIHVAGTNYIDISDINALSYDNLNAAIYGVPTESAANGKFFFNRQTLALLQTVKNETTGQYVWSENTAVGAQPTIWGKPYVLTEVLSGPDGDGNDYIVFGDLRYVTLGERTGLNIKIFDSGAVGDPDGDIDGNDLNLLTQDMQAMRAVKRFNAKVRFPAAFSVIGTVADAS